MNILLRGLVLASATILYYATNPTALCSNAVCLGLILLVGVPHGAADHRIHSTINKNSNTLLYILQYVLIAGGYVLWWLIAPGKAALLFLILSSYHFGQEFLEDLNLSSVKVWEILLWGVALLFVPILISYQEIRDYFHFVTDSTLPQLGISVRLVVSGVILLGAIVHISYLFSSQKISMKALYSKAASLLLLSLSFALLPFLIAFTLYFVLFHSINALAHQYKWLKHSLPEYSPRRFLQDLSLFSFLSIGGIVLLLFVVQPRNMEEAIGYFFVLISVVTLPHSILFDQFYSFRKSKKIQEESAK